MSTYGMPVPPGYELVPYLPKPETRVLIRTPIILYEPIDLGAYASVSVAEMNIEPWYVLNNEFSLYDAEGRLLQPIVPGGNVDNWVKIYCVEEHPTHESELKDAIVEYLCEGQPQKLWASTDPLDTLIAALHITD